MLSQKLNEVFTSKKTFIYDSLNWWGFLLSALVNIIHWVVLYFKLKPGGSNILLHYNVIYGPDFIGPSVYVYALPATALILLLLNLVVASSFYKKEKLASYFLAFATLAVQLIFFVAGIVLIVIND